MNVKKDMYRLVFVGGFGTYFLWTLVMILGIIPILGTFFQFLFLKWTVRNIVLAPLSLTRDELKSFVERSRLAEKVEQGL